MRRKLVPIVVLVALIVVAVVPVYGQAGAPNPGAGRGNIFIQNIGSGPANLVLSFTRGAGISTGPASFTYNVNNLAVGGSKALLYTTCWQDGCTSPGTPVPDGWAGAVQISSDQPLASIANLFWTGIPSAGTYSGFGTPATTVYLPNLLKSTSRRTVVTVQNTEGTSAANVQMVYFNRNGTAVYTGTATIPANSMQQFDLSTIAGVDFSATSGTGSLKITHATNKLTAVASIHYPAGDRGAAVYGGFVGGSPTVWFPSQFRRYSGATPTLYNANIVQNLGTQPANVTVSFLDRNNVNNQSCTDTIQPGASQGYNMITQGTAPAGCWTAIQALGTNWSGTVKIVSTNAQPLAGVGFYFSTTNVNDVLAFEAIPDEGSGSKLFAPAVYRKLSGATSSQQWSTTLVQNLENVPRTLTIKFYNTAGVQVGAAGGYSVPVAGNASVGLNLNTGVNLPAQALTDLGTNFSGGMVVEGSAGSKLVGVTNIFYETPGAPIPAGSREQGGAYDTFPAP
jgi:hypothetical protein